MRKSLIAIVFGLSLLIVGAAASKSEAVGCIEGMSILGQPNPCDFGGLTFSNFQITSTIGVTSATIGFGTGSDVNGPWVNITFNVVHQPSPCEDCDITFSYDVSGPSITGVDLKLNAFFGNTTIIETVTDANGFVTSLFVNSSDLANESFFTARTSIHIVKDIQLPCSQTVGTECTQGSAISDFVNSHHFDKIPEPASMLLFGFGLVGLGIWGRKRFGK
jgi:hypothetical protein